MTKRFFSITNPPPCNMENYDGVISLADPSQDEPLISIVRKLLNGTIKAPKPTVSFDTEDLTKVNDVDSFMTANEPLRPGYSDLSDAQVYAELAKDTIARLKRGSKENKEEEPSTPSESEKSESEANLDRSNEDLSGNGA